MNFSAPPANYIMSPTTASLAAYINSILFMISRKLQIYLYIFLKQEMRKYADPRKSGIPVFRETINFKFEAPKLTSRVKEILNATVNKLYIIRIASEFYKHLYRHISSLFHTCI